MKFEVNVSKFRFFILLGAVVIVAGVFGVWAALQPGVAPPNGHTGDQIEVNINGQAMTLQQAINNNEFSGTEGIQGCTIRTHVSGESRSEAHCLSGEFLTGGGCNGKSWDGIEGRPLNSTTWYCRDGGSDSSVSESYAICCH